MSWLYKYFRLILGGTYPALEMHEADLKFASGSTVTLQSGSTQAIASGATQTIAGTQTVTGTINVNVMETVTGATSTATPSAYRVFTLGTGSSPVFVYVGNVPTAALGPTPTHLGDILITSTGRLAICTVAGATTGWYYLSGATTP